MKRLILVAGATCVLAGAANAQGTVSGKWTTDYPTGIRVENGEPAVASSRPGTFTLTMKGDSVLGTWQLSPDKDGKTSPPQKITGKKSGTSYVMRDEPVDRTVNMGNGPTQVKMLTEWTFQLKGDALEGTQKNLSPDGSFDGPELPFKAARAKGM